MIDGVFNCV